MACTGDRGVKLPGFRQAQGMATSVFCITDTNDLRYLLLVMSEMQGVKSCRREHGQVGPGCCVELKCCHDQEGQTIGEAAAKLSIGNGIRGNSSLMDD